MKKQRIFNIIQIGNKEDIVSRAFDIFIAAVIILNVFVMVLQTFSNLSPYFPILDAVALVTIIIFGIEYVLRIWTADLLYPNLYFHFSFYLDLWLLEFLESLEFSTCLESMDSMILLQ